MTDFKLREQTATAINNDNFLIYSAYNRLCMHPEQQARAIAGHYAAHHKMARELLALIEARDRAHQYNIDIADSISENIAYLLDMIKKNHRQDLGIELEWPNKTGGFK